VARTLEHEITFEDVGGRQSSEIGGDHRNLETREDIKDDPRAEIYQRRDAARDQVLRLRQARGLLQSV
jgi:hypothetical protein